MASQKKFIVKKINPFVWLARTTVSTGIAGVGITGSLGGASKVKDVVTKATNPALGWVAGGATFILGTAVTVSIIRGVEAHVFNGKMDMEKVVTGQPVVDDDGPVVSPDPND